jgi:hypothetical protein
MCVLTLFCDGGFSAKEEGGCRQFNSDPTHRLPMKSRRKLAAYVSSV